MSFLQIYLMGLAVIGFSVTLLWLISLAKKDSSIVDIFWGTGFVITGWTYFALTDGYPARKWLIIVLVTIWGLRLSIHLALRNLPKGEDFRYRKWREEAGDSWWWRSYFKVFLLQGVIMWLVSLPLLGAQISMQPQSLTVIDGLGFVLWLAGFIFEAVGDWQLVQFKANQANTGQVLNSGLWRYTRHPNYFGDAVQWWGFFLIAAAAGAWWTIISPLLMTWLLMRVSGVTMLEEMLKHTKPQYREYIIKTSAFFPMPPKS
jgi:steroid 5-alpha reductase family enzyme